MTKTGHEGLTPTGAAQVLDELEAYEEPLTTRTLGITWMIWGIAVPGIFLTYGVGSSWAEAIGAPWLNALFWIPWVVGAGIATQSLWTNLALTFSWEKGNSLVTVGYTVLFFALALGLWATGLIEEINMLMLAASGLLTMAIALIPTGHEVGSKPIVLSAGVLILLIAVALDVTWAGAAGPTSVASLIAAATVGVVYHGMGLLFVQRG